MSIFTKLCLYNILKVYIFWNLEKTHVPFAPILIHSCCNLNSKYEYYYPTLFYIYINIHKISYENFMFPVYNSIVLWQIIISYFYDQRFTSSSIYWIIFINYNFDDYFLTIVFKFNISTMYPPNERSASTPYWPAFFKYYFHVLGTYLLLNDYTIHIFTKKNKKFEFLQ